MPKKDLNQTAYSIVRIATGEEEAPPAKKLSAVSAGRKGGTSRANKLPAEERRRIASAAAKARWKK